MRPDEYTAIAVRPSGAVSLYHMRLSHLTDGGTRYHDTIGRAEYRNWAELLRRRKPWTQRGPVFIYSVMPSDYKLR